MTATVQQIPPAGTPAPAPSKSELAKAAREARKNKVKPVVAGDANSLAAMAAEFARFIRDQKLFTLVQGKEFVNVEGWQYLAGRLGYILDQPAESLVDKSNGEEIKYQAYARLFHPASGTYAGGGFAVCSNKEQGKKFYQEFAIASMAQTRAVSKAVRVPLAYYMKAAGFEVTPAEELDWNGAPPATAPAPAQLAPAPVVTPVVPEPEPAPVMRAITARSAEATTTPVQYATASQREEIIRLMNHTQISRSEKTKMLLNINRLDEKRAGEAILKARASIERREQGLETKPVE